MRKSIVSLVALIAISAAGHAAPACHNGSYRTAAGDLIVISGPTLHALRYTLPDGHAVLGECDAAGIELALDDGPSRRWDRMPLRITETRFDSAGFFDMPADWIHGGMTGRSYGAARITLHRMR